MIRSLATITTPMRMTNPAAPKLNVTNLAEWHRGGWISLTLDLLMRLGPLDLLQRQREPKNQGSSLARRQVNQCVRERMSKRWNCVTSIVRTNDCKLLNRVKTRL